MKATLSMFMLLFAVALGAQNLTGTEYFIDADPGFGQAVALAVPPQENVVNFDFSIPLPATLSDGLHVVGLRAKDSNGRWSQTNFHTFQTRNNVPVALADMEYFWDKDPGFGNGFQVPFSQEVAAVSVMAPFDLLPGLHAVFFRVRDENGRFSHTNYRIDVEVSTLATAAFETTHIGVYPNPVSDKLYVVSQEEMPSRLVVFDALGRTVADRTIDADATLDCSHWPGGTYYVQLWLDAHRLKTCRIIKN